jgi:YbbR domain-containing protein
VILNDSNTALHITLKTHGFGWLKYYVKQPQVTIDFTEEVTKTPSKFIWGKSKAYLNNTQFGKQEELLNILPDTLIFRYDVNMVKKVPVVLNLDIKFSPGFDVFESITSKPDSVIIIGARELVTEVKSIEAELLKLNEVKADINQSIMLKLSQKSKGLKYSDKTVRIEAHVERFTEGVMKIPVNIVNVPEGLSLSYFPKMVNVTYYTSLNNFAAVTSKDFKVECNYAEVSQAQPFLIPALVKMPKTVKNAKINQQRIEFIIKE